MVLKRTEVSHAGRVSYDLSAYQCAYEDVWVTVEVPQEEKT